MVTRRRRLHHQFLPLSHSTFDSTQLRISGWLPRLRSCTRKPPPACLILHPRRLQHLPWIHPRPSITTQRSCDPSSDSRSTSVPPDQGLWCSTSSRASPLNCRPVCATICTYVHTTPWSPIRLHVLQPTITWPSSTTDTITCFLLLLSTTFHSVLPNVAVPAAPTPEGSLPASPPAEYETANFYQAVAPRGEPTDSSFYDYSVDPMAESTSDRFVFSGKRGTLPLSDFIGLFEGAMRTAN